MQGRVAFNAGEFAPEMSARSDIDYYNRGCLTLENWELSQLGGIKRRRGMRRFAVAHSENSRLIPYVYSYAEGKGLRYLVEVDSDLVKVWNEEGGLVKAFRSSADVPFNIDLAYLKYKQINAMLILTSPTNPPLVLQYTDDKEWTLKHFDFRFKPWKEYETRRDEPVIVSLKEPLQYEVEFSDKLDERERKPMDGDVLRVTHWMEEQEVKQSSKSLREGITIVEDLPDTAKLGDKFAIKGETSVKYYSCIQDYNKDNLVTGLDMPANYTSAFLASEDLTDFDSVEPVTGLSEYFSKNNTTTIKKGTKLAIEVGYWEYYTCIKDFDTKEHGRDKFTDYPRNFISGIPVGNAVPCGGEWVFFCSGIWYGCYEIRRNYDSNLLDREWESRGISFSRNESVSNIQTSGSEADEECWLRLFLTKSRWAGESLEDGFPNDGTGNRLIVRSYKHDTLLRCDVKSGTVSWVDVSPIKIEHAVSQEYHNWSWQAFSERYGYPYHCEVFGNRLLFASTNAQPQTLFFSVVDDINNFKAGTTDDAAMSLTMMTDTQNPICWIKPRKRQIMLGTSEGEHIVSGNAQTGVFSSSTASVDQHGYIGSTDIAAVGASGNLLYIERGGGRVWSFSYSLEIDGWRSEDVSVFACHVAREHGGFKRASIIKKPDTTILYVTGDGQLALCCYNPLQEIKAWHRWITDGKIKDVCGLANGSANDRIFLVVKRVDGSYIEVVDEDSDYTDNGVDYVSEMKTTALNNFLEAYVAKKRNPIVKLCVADGFDLIKENLTVSTDGETWWPSDMWDGYINKGWHQFIAPKSWAYEQFVALRVKGNQAFNFIALQA